jgi:hypothetical protein
MKNQIKIVSYFSLPTDLAGEMRDWKEFVSGAGYTVELRNDETGATIAVNYDKAEDGLDYVIVDSDTADELFDRAVGRVIRALSKHSDNLMVY